MKPAHAAPLLTKGSNVSLGVAAFFASRGYGDGETEERRVAVPVFVANGADGFA